MDSEHPIRAYAPIGPAARASRGGVRDEAMVRIQGAEREPHEPHERWERLLRRAVHGPEQVPE